MTKLVLFMEHIDCLGDFAMSYLYKVQYQYTLARLVCWICFDMVWGCSPSGNWSTQLIWIRRFKCADMLFVWYDVCLDW